MRQPANRSANLPSALPSAPRRVIEGCLSVMLLIVGFDRLQEFEIAAASESPVERRVGTVTAPDSAEFARLGMCQRIEPRWTLPEYDASLRIEPRAVSSDAISPLAMLPIPAEFYSVPSVPQKPERTVAVVMQHDSPSWATSAVSGNPVVASEEATIILAAWHHAHSAKTARSEVLTADYRQSSEPTTTLQTVSAEVQNWTWDAADYGWNRGSTVELAHSPSVQDAELILPPTPTTARPVAVTLATVLTPEWAESQSAAIACSLHHPAESESIAIPMFSLNRAEYAGPNTESPVTADWYDVDAMSLADPTILGFLAGFGCLAMVGLFIPLERRNG